MCARHTVVHHVAPPCIIAHCINNDVYLRHNIQTDVSRRGELHLPRIILHVRYFCKLSSPYAIHPPLFSHPSGGETFRFALHERVIILSINHRPRVWSDRKRFMAEMMIYIWTMFELVIFFLFHFSFFFFWHWNEEMNLRNISEIILHLFW